MKASFFVVIATILLAACTMQKGASFDTAKISYITPGVTTKTEVENLLGKDYRTNPLQNGEEMVYLYSSSMETGLLGGLKTNQDDFVVVLHNNIVNEKYILRNGSKTTCAINNCLDSSNQTKLPTE